MGWLFRRRGLHVAISEHPVEGRERGRTGP